jgi:Na+-transporting methylmalonyl-CoA/oxaloacetate decarboxylase gamma subunit
LAFEEYPQWTEPETTAPREVATDPEIDMLYPPSREVSSVESLSEPVSAPNSNQFADSNQFAVSPELVDPESSPWAVGFVVTLLAVLIALLLLIPIVDGIGWFARRVLRSRRHTAESEAMVDNETASGAVQKDEAVAPSP